MLLLLLLLLLLLFIYLLLFFFFTHPVPLLPKLAVVQKHCLDPFHKIRVCTSPCCTTCLHKTTPTNVKWRTVPVCVKELSLADVLPTGQAFRWNKTESDPSEWTGAIGDK